MKHTEQKIIEKSKKILKDIEFEYHKDIPFRVRFTESKAILGHNSLIDKGFMVSIDWYDPDYLGGNDVTAFLTIDDDTGEPEELSVRSGGGGNWVIKKNDVGKYFVESNY